MRLTIILELILVISHCYCSNEAENNSVSLIYSEFFYYPISELYSKNYADVKIIPITLTKSKQYINLIYIIC